MKHLHFFIIKSFFPIFMATFLVTWFVFVMQFFWLYIDDFVGKDLDFFSIAKIIFYLAPTVIPLTLPLGILLASIMTFGNIAESSELTAIKSAGISLWRITQPLFVFVCILSMVAYLIYDKVIPISQLKFNTMLLSIRSTKPAVNIRAGFFYDELPGYSMYIASKEANNEDIHGIVLYDQSSNKGNDKVVLAKDGKMYVTKDKKYLVFELFNGSRYEEKQGKTLAEKDLVRLQFKYWKKIFDLSAFEMHKTDEGFLANNEIMLSNAKIQKRIDSTYKMIARYQTQNASSLQGYFTMASLDSNTSHFTNKFVVNNVDGIQKDSLYMRAVSAAQSNIEGIKGMADIYLNDYNIQVNNLNNFKVEWHGKITKALNCLVLFLIGVPLGALIKKGGFGMPFVTAVIFFVILYFMDTYCQKLAEGSKISAFWGMWGPIFFLSLVAIWLFYLANKDKSIRIPIPRFVQKIFAK